MKENSIEEDMKILEEFKTHGYAMLLIKYEDRNKTNLKLDQAIEHILQDYKRVLKENEELEEINNELEAEKNEAIRRYNFETIPIQKVKNKIEEILNNGEYTIIFEGDAEFPDEATRIDAQKYIKLEKLQELLEKER